MDLNWEKIIEIIQAFDPEYLIEIFLIFLVIYIFLRFMEGTRGRNPNRRPTQSDEAFERVKGQILQSERVAAKEAERTAHQREQALLDFDTEIPL